MLILIAYVFFRRNKYYCTDLAVFFTSVSFSRRLFDRILRDMFEDMLVCFHHLVNILLAVSCDYSFIHLIYNAVLWCCIRSINDILGDLQKNSNNCPDSNTFLLNAMKQRLRLYILMTQFNILFYDPFVAYLSKLTVWTNEN